MSELLKSNLIKFLQSEYYHNEIKGCKIEPKYISIGRHNNVLKGAYCKIHQKDICRCGYEFGYHYGTESKKL